MAATITMDNCNVHGRQKHRRQKDGRDRCVKCDIDRIDKLRRKRKDELLTLFGGRCNRCGYNKSKNALQFHHVNPSTKSFQLCIRTMTKPMKLLLEEASKCELLCANCHAEEHDIAISRVV